MSRALGLKQLLCWLVYQSVKSAHMPALRVAQVCKFEIEKSVGVQGLGDINNDPP